jgi:hypothetical protein
MADTRLTQLGQLDTAYNNALSAGSADAEQLHAQAVALAQDIHDRPDLTPAPTVNPNNIQGTNEPKAGTPEWQAKYGATSGMSGIDKFMSGAGQAVVDSGRGIQQLFHRATGDTAALNQDKQNVDEARQRDAELDRTGAGLAGNIAGNVAEMAIPGMGASAAATRLGLIGARLGATTPLAARIAAGAYGAASSAPAVGAAMGAIGPTGTDDTVGGNTLRGAAFGTAGKLVGSAGNAILRTGEDALSAGARKSYEIAQKYGVPLKMQNLLHSQFAKYLDSASGEMPMSGAENVAENQRAGFNEAVSGTTGETPPNPAMNTVDLEKQRKIVGSQIGDMADTHTAFITPQHISDINNVQQDLVHATPEVQQQVNSYIGRLFNNHVPINNPLPGGPIAQIPGTAWRENNTALSNHIASLGDNDGDLSRRLEALHGTYMDMMESGMPPEDFDAFQQLRGQYANIMTVKPLVRKAPPGQGIDPKLLQGTVLNADRDTMGGGQQTPLGELGQLGKQLVSKTPNSGTAYRHLLIGTGIGGIGGLIEHEAGGDNDNPQNDILHGLSVPAAMVAAGLMHRGANSALMTKYFAARAPQIVQDAMGKVTSALPAAAVRTGQMGQIPGTAPADTEAGIATHLPQPEADVTPGGPGMADGGQVQKSTFWDLVHQGWKELTGGDDSPTPAQRVGIASGNPSAPYEGTGGADRNAAINQQVDSQS